VDNELEEESDMSVTEVDPRGKSPLWGLVLGLIEEVLSRRASTKLFVEVPDKESGPYRKEIGDLSAGERNRLHPALARRVAEMLLDRYLARQGYLDLLERSSASRKKVRELLPEDLPALIEADRQKIEEMQRIHSERAKFVEEARAGWEDLPVLELARMKSDEERGEIAR
jgi:hypothetical protein